MHLGILTGGGDVPGLNPAIKAVVNEAFARDWRVTGFRRGWAGPVNSDPENLEGTRSARIVLTPDVVRSINRTGGTILHTSRTNPSRMRASDLPGFLLGKNEALTGVVGGNIIATVVLAIIIAVSFAAVVATIVVPTLPALATVPARLALLGRLGR